ncbi:MAG TPA: cytochrome c oxidase subunit II [Marmoricola sp.]|nr:cytochrome c oxidase subunit II [Marmoricola sp.]
MGLEIPKRARRVLFGGILAGAMLSLSGCSSERIDQIKRFALPIPSSKEAWHTYDLWRWAWVAALLTGLLVWGLMFYAWVAFRRRRADEIPVQTRYNLPIEIFYTIAPIVMVIVFFFFTVSTQEKVDHDIKNPDHTVWVVGQQWSWTFNYQHESAIGGKTVWESGTTAHRPTLWLVKGQTVEFHLYSPDVIHSFWVPNFLFKKDVVPGRDNRFGITPTRYGTFEGRCAELCGVYHSRMLFNVKVVNEQQFDAHLRQLQKAGDTGLNLGNKYANTVAGLDNTDQAFQGNKSYKGGAK